jgi:hypothetical protein
MTITKSAIGWLAAGILIGTLATGSVGTVMAQKPESTPTVTQYGAVCSVKAVNDETGQVLTQILNNASKQGYSYVGSTGICSIFKK